MTWPFSGGDSKFKAFLESPDGRAFLLGVVTEERLRKELDPVLLEAQQHLVGEVDAKLSAIRKTLDSDAHTIAHALRHSLEERMRQHAQSVVIEILSTHLHELLRKEVRDFIRSNPVDGQLTKRQLAAANGISIRAVKRRKRDGEIM